MQILMMLIWYKLPLYATLLEAAQLLTELVQSMPLTILMMMELQLMSSGPFRMLMIFLTTLYGLLTNQSLTFRSLGPHLAMMKGNALV